jgi:C2H2 transcription facotor
MGVLDQSEMGQLPTAATGAFDNQDPAMLGQVLFTAANGISSSSSDGYSDHDSPINSMRKRKRDE